MDIIAQEKEHLPTGRTGVRSSEPKALRSSYPFLVMLEVGDVTQD